MSSRRARGQAMVLSALSFLLLALMVMMSFNLSHALRQKINLQQHSDTLAYSMGVLEARALNYYAVGNRAIAASFVAMNSLHAYMAAASVTGEMMRAAEDNFDAIALQELAQCACKTCIKHCFHAKEAKDIAGDYGDAADRYDRKVKGLESSFNRATKGLDDMMDSLHASQRAVHDKTLKAVKDGRSLGLAALTEFNAKGAAYLPDAVGRLNENEFNCAVDGMECTGSVSSTSAKARARVMTEVANASRSGWPANRSFSGGIGIKIPKYLHSDFFKELKDIPNRGSQIVRKHSGTAKTTQDSSSVDGPGQQGGNEGSTSAASEEGNLFHSWRDGAWESDYSSAIWSDRNGGGHEPGGAHSGSHRFEGANAKALNTCAQSGNCFMKFRANPDGRRDWGQPRVYSYVTKQLRTGLMNKTPWELNSSGKFQFRNGAQGAATLNLAAGDGAALSKGLIYYHRLGAGGWQEPPNLFGPYWRVKLHPFDGDEAGKVLDEAGNSDASEMAQTPGVSL